MTPTSLSCGSLQGVFISLGFPWQKESEEDFHQNVPDFIWHALKEECGEGVLSLGAVLLTLRTTSADESITPSLQRIPAITSQDGEEQLQNGITKNN